MGTSTEEIALLTVRGQSDGMDKVKSDIDGVAKSQDNLVNSSNAVAEVFQKNATKQLDAGVAVEQLRQKLEGTYYATRAFGEGQTKVNQALDQGKISQSEAASVLQLLAEKYPKAAQAQDLLSNGMTRLISLFTGNAAAGTKSAEIATLLEARQLKLASSVGLVGEALAVIGPYGIAAAAGVGAVLVVLDQMGQAAERMGGVAREISSFSSVTGLATDSVQALRSEGVKFGLSTEETGTAIERFTYNLDAAHSATGPLYDQIQKINPALSVQLALSKSTGDALNILAKAYAQAGDEAQKSALVRAAAGRNAGPEFGGLLQGINDSGGVSGVTREVNALDLITKDQIEHWKTLSAQIEEGSTTWRNNIASIFTGSVLESQKSFEDTLVSISRELKSFSQTDAFSGMASAFRTMGDVLKATTVPLQLLWQVSGKIANAIPTAGDLRDSQPQASDFSTRFGNATGAIQNAGPSVTSRIDDSAAQIKASQEATLGLAQATSLLNARQLEYNQAQEKTKLLLSTGVADEAQLSNARRSEGNALANVATEEKNRIATLNGAATGEEILKAKTDALTAAMLQGTLSADDYNRALHGDTANQIAALQDQNAVINSIGFAQKSAAQYAADYAAAVRAGREPLDAEAIAAAKLANSQDAAQQSARKMVQSSQDNLDKIQAQGTGMEGVVSASIAYRDAIQAGASYGQAAAIYANNLAASLAQAAQAQNQLDQATAAYDAQQIAAGKASGLGTFNPFNTTPGTQYTSTNISAANLATLNSLPPNSPQAAAFIAWLNGTIYRPPPPTGNQVVDNSVTAGGVNAGIATAKGLGDISSVQTLYSLLNSQTNNNATKITNDQQFLAWLQTQPQTIASLQAMSSLTSEIQSLSQSTNSLNSTMQSALSPYYTTDPRTSHIGFRSQGMATGGEITIPGGYSANDNMTVTVPVASGELLSVRRPGQGGGGITINMPITIQGSANPNEFGRTAFQAGQSMARQLAAVSR